MSGPFPAGRPQWEAAGVTIVDDAAPFEQRKLCLLNGSHSLLAYAGSVRGHPDDRRGDRRPRRAAAGSRQLWDEASPHLPLPADDSRPTASALLDRYANPRIRHRLAQIAADGSIKLLVRTLPVIRAERRAGRVPLGCADRGGRLDPAPARAREPRYSDPGADPYLAAVDDDDETAVRAVLEPARSRPLGCRRPRRATTIWCQRSIGQLSAVVEDQR